MYELMAVPLSLNTDSEGLYDGEATCAAHASAYPLANTLCREFSVDPEIDVTVMFDPTGCYRIIAHLKEQSGWWPENTRQELLNRANEWLPRAIEILHRVSSAPDPSAMQVVVGDGSSHDATVITDSDPGVVRLAQKLRDLGTRASGLCDNVVIGGRSYALRHSEIRTRIQEAETVCSTAEIRGVLDESLVAAVKLDDQKASVQLNYPPEFREQLLDAQRAMSKVCIEYEPVVLRQAGRQRTEGGTIKRISAQATLALDA